MAIKIDKGIPVPLGYHSSVWPFEEMKTGESFLVPNEGDVRSRVYSAASYFGKRNNKKFTVRKVPEGLRVWRTA